MQYNTHKGFENLFDVFGRGVLGGNQDQLTIFSETARDMDWVNVVSRFFEHEIESVVDFGLRKDRTEMRVSDTEAVAEFGTIGRIDVTGEQRDMGDEECREGLPDGLVNLHC